MTRENDPDAAAHALDALSDEERARHEQAVERDPALRASQDEFDTVAAQLAAVASPVAPPDEMKARLMAAIAELPQQDPAAAQARRPSDVQGAGADQDDAADAGERAAPPTRAEQRARRRWYARPPMIALTAAAAAALVFAGGAVVGTLVTGDSPAQSTAADKLASINAAPDVQRTQLQADGIAAALVWSESLELSAVVMDNLPAAPNGSVYEAWYIDEDGAAPAGTFAADAGTTWHVLDGAFTPGATIGITVEPEGGSDQPTSDPIMAIETS